MKKLAGLVIVLAALVLSGYYGMGILTEKTIRKNIGVIDQSNGLYAEISQYNRGLFSSDAKIKWQLHIPARTVKDASGRVQAVPAQDFNIDTPITIHHGPIIFTNNHLRFGLGYAESVFPLPEQYNAQFDSMFTKDSMKPQLDLSLFVNYFNQSTTDISVPAFNVTAKEGNGHFSWLGMNAKTTMSSEMKKISGTVVADGMKITKDDAKIDLGKVSTDYDLHETLAGLYLGDANFNLPTFKFLMKDQKIFELNDLIIQSASDIEQQLFNTHFTATLKSVYVNGQDYGPGDFELALRNLDANVLAKINQEAAAMQNGTEAQRQQAMISLLPELPKLFNKGAELEISKLSLKIPQGQIEGNLFVSLPKDENANPFELMQKIHGTAKLKVPTEAVKQIMHQSVMQQLATKPDMQQSLTQQLQAVTTTQPNQPTLTPEQLASAQVDKQLSMLQQNGLITVQGTDYSIEVTLDQGKFVINGKPFDSSMLKF